jgi:hypothetical protein
MASNSAVPWSAEEQPLDADHVAVWHDRQSRRAFDRAAAGLSHAHGNLRLQRMGGRRQLVDSDWERRFAVGAGRQQSASWMGSTCSSTRPN